MASRLILTFLIVASPRSSSLPNPPLIALLWILALVGLIGLYVIGAKERFGSRIAYVAFALVLCYWSLLGLAHSRALIRGGAAAAKIAGANGETVARFAAMPTLANMFRWDCVFETDRATYRFSLSLMDDENVGNPVRYVKTPELLDNVSQQRPARVFLGLRVFPSRNSKIPDAPRVLSFNWLTCVTLSRAEREAVSHSKCPLNARCNNRRMNETKEFNSLPVLSEVREERERAEKSPILASVRVSPGPYLALASVITFIAALLLRAQYDIVAIALVTGAWLVIPVLALTDRITFDGRSLRRLGPIPSLLQLFIGYRKQLAIDDFETVETQAVRTLRRGGRVRYRYRTQITGKGKEFVIVSGGYYYRHFVRQLFPLIHESKLDNRSRDLRDYLHDPSFLNRKTQLSQLASSDLLDVTKSDFKLGGKCRSVTGNCRRA